MTPAIKSGRHTDMHKKKRRLRAVCAVLLIVSMILSPVVLGYACYAAARPDDSGAGAVYLYCLSNASVLYSRDARKEFPASSSAKMMTALLTIENTGDPLEKIELTEQLLEGCSGSEYGFSVGAVATAEDLLKALILANSDNAAKICANLISGSREEFVVLMNERAKELSMNNTKYTTPHGYDTDDAVTTAEDTAKLSVFLHGMTAFMNIASLPYTSLTTSDELIYTRNNFIGKWYSLKYYDSDVTGMHACTTESGTTLVATADKSDGYSYLCVVLDGKTVLSENKAYTVASSLIDWAVGNFGYRELVSSGRPVTSVKVNNADKTDSVPVFPSHDVVLYLPDYISDDDIKYEYNVYSDELDAPFSKGTEVGEITVYCEGRTVATVSLVTGAGASLSKSARLTESLISFLTHPAVIIIALAALTFALLRVVGYIRKKRRLPKK